MKLVKDIRGTAVICLILKKVDSQTYKKMYYLHAESQEKYFEDVIRLHKSGCSNGAISRLLPVSKTTVSKWISIFVREKGQIMRVKRTEKLVEPDGESAMERLSKENSEILSLIAADSQMFMAQQTACRLTGRFMVWLFISQGFIRRHMTVAY